MGILQNLRLNGRACTKTIKGTLRKPFSMFCLQKILQEVKHGLSLSQGLFLQMLQCKHELSMQL
jgi:hypothetical protein